MRHSKKTFPNTADTRELCRIGPVALDAEEGGPGDQRGGAHSQPQAEIYSEEHTSSIFRQSSNPVCGCSMMEQVRLCAVWPMENWLGSPMNRTQG